MQTDDIVVQKALRYAQLTFKRHCLEKRHMLGAFLPDESSEMESILRELNMKPAEILAIAEKSHIPQSGC
jgi:hypothetical protein